MTTPNTTQRTKRSEKKTAQHTPGPWNVQGRHAMEVSGPSGSHIICDVGQSATPTNAEDYATAQADARLIAQAPAMYSVLRDLCEYVAPGKDTPLRAMLDDARAILAAIDGSAR